MTPYIGIIKDEKATYPALVLFRWRDKLYVCPRLGAGRFVASSDVEHVVNVAMDNDVSPKGSLEAAALGDYDSRMNIYRWWDSLSQDSRDEFFGVQ